MHPATEAFMDLFDGLRVGHGTYTITGTAEKGQKNKGVAKTVSAQVTHKIWDEHLEGKQGLGIVPINADSMCKFGAIDVDDYEMSLEALNKNIVDNKMPLVLCRTKSGGAHLYLFTTDFVSAELMQMKLREMASFLGYGNREIFPKQTILLADRGDHGSWINMPYFGGANSDRYAIGKDHRPIRDLEKFVEYARLRRLRPRDLENTSYKQQELLPGGPPCLQFLVKQGFPEGTRNNGMYNLAVYAKKAHPDTWQQEVDQYNGKYLNKPLSPVEVMTIIKSVAHKEYNYTCKQPPIQQYCNAAICRTCKHGIGGADVGMPKMGTLSKLKTVPPIWFLDVETELGTGRLELATEELQNPLAFQRACMAKLSIMPSVLKRDNWQEVVRNLLARVTEIEVPEEATPQGIFMHHFENFCMGRVQARVCDEILAGKPWHHNGEIHFRMSDLLAHLDRARFKMEPNKIQMILKEIPGWRKKFHNIKNKGANCQVIPENTFQKFNGQLPVPPQAPDVM